MLYIERKNMFSLIFFIHRNPEVIIYFFIRSYKTFCTFFPIETSFLLIIKRRGYFFLSHEESFEYIFHHCMIDLNHYDDSYCNQVRFQVNINQIKNLEYNHEFE